MTEELYEQLETEAGNLGIAPTELARRRIEGDDRVLSQLAELKEMMSNFATSGGVGIPVNLDDGARGALENIARELGFLDPAHLLKALANRVVSDPDAIRGLLFDELRDDSRARAEAEFARRNSDNED